MAQIDLGSIKFNWKGSYSGATAYVVDDVVESSGSSYICIAATTGNAPPNATYWEQMSSAGTDGTDLTTTLTTQGDIVYRDASGLARLGAGTSGYFLKTQGTGANPIWAEAGGGLVQTVFNSSNTSYQNGSTTYTSTVEASITPSSTSNNILIFANSVGYYHNSNANGIDRNHFWRILRTTGGVDTEIANAEQRSDSILNGSFVPLAQSLIDKDNPSTTSSITYKFQMKGAGGGWDYYTNHNSTYASQITLMEVKV
jgi:hypothetical protein